MKFGYARVSSTQQNLDMQIDAINDYGVDEIYQEKESGKTRNRPELQKLIDKLRKGDTLVVWRLDRLGRTVLQLLELIEYFEQNGIELVSLADSIDTSSSQGKALLVVASAFSEMENEIRTERIKVGVAAARARGRVGGRPPIDKNIITKAEKLYFTGEFSIKEILKITGISRTTLYKYINKAERSKRYVKKIPRKE